MFLPQAMQAILVLANFLSCLLLTLLLTLSVNISLILQILGYNCLQFLPSLALHSPSFPVIVNNSFGRGWVHFELLGSHVHVHLLDLHEVQELHLGLRGYRNVSPFESVFLARRLLVALLRQTLLLRCM